MARPASVAISHIGKMRRQQRMEAVVVQVSLERHKANFLQQHVSPRIRQHFLFDLFDLVAAFHGVVGQFVGGDSWFDRKVAEGTMSLLLGEESAAVGDNQAEVAGAGLIDSGEIDFIENAMTQREPNPAVEVQGSARACLSARSPARLDSGPARGITEIIAHGGSLSPSSSLPEDENLCLPSSRTGGEEHLMHSLC